MPEQSPRPARPGLDKPKDPPALEIDARRFDAARRNPKIQKFLREAAAENERLRREGLIHP